MGAADTIVALASGSLPSGVAVVRLSGPKSLQILEDMCGPVPPARQLSLRSIRRPSGAMLDQGLVAVFPGPRSFTGEDCAELHLHGSPAVVRAVVDEIAALPDVRLASAGEFTRRAFENGRLDLVEVEGLGDLIAAETEAQRGQALGRMRGGLSVSVEAWRAGIIECMAELQAHLDFSDEGDVGDVDLGTVRSGIAEVRSSIDAALKTFEGGRIVREGYRVVLAGPPNVGKSSVLNRLAKSDVAIVTEEAGTTRDVREVEIDVEGHLVILVDSAGIRETESKAEAEGVRRAREAIGSGDLVLWLSAPDVPPEELVGDAGERLIRVRNKADLGQDESAELSISAHTGEGFSSLVALLSKRVATAVGGGGGLTISHMRDKEALESCLTRLKAAENRLGELELASEELRQAAAALERLIGRIDVEHVLDRLFAGFCIGK